MSCATYGRQIDQSAASRIERGKTTKNEVIALLGSPDQVTNFNGQTTFTYSYARVAVKGATYIPYIGPFVGGTRSQNQMFVVTFDQNDVVTNVMSSYGASETGLGAAAGPKPTLTDVEEGKRPLK